MQRMQTLLDHLGPAASRSFSDSGICLQKTAGAGATFGAAGVAPRRMVERADDIVIVSALRTPIGKAKRGSFKVRICTYQFTQKSVL